MSINITMPALSPTMEEGTLAKWHVKEGDTVAPGDVIAEIETDKATMEVEAVDEGKIGKIVIDEGTEEVKVNSVIAVLLEEGESADDIGDVSAAPKAEEKPAEKAAEPEAKPAPAAPQQATPAPAPAPAAAAPATAGDSKRTFASPLARRLAKEAGIDVSALVGSGPKGRVVKADVEKAKSEGVPQKSAPGAVAPPPAMDPSGVYEEGTFEAVKNDGMRKTVAARLTEARQTIPQFYISADIKIDALMAARAEINAAAPKGEDGKPTYKISVNDFVIKAWALALQQVPKANCTWAGEAIYYHKVSDVAVAVAVEGGLFTPVVRKCEQKTLRQISAEVKDLATRAKTKKLAPHEYVGGSTAVSNLGMFGVTHFTSIINPPHGTIISIGAGEERVYPDNGEIKVGTFMTVSLSCDHRTVDGALGATLLNAFKALIENPVMMLV